MVTFLACCCILTATGFAISLFYVFKFARIILRIEEVIEVSLLGFDESYNKLSDILEKPVFFDSPEVRQTIDEIAKARELILSLANELAGSLQEDDKESGLNEESSDS